jgi:hypothetical protein
MMEIIEQLGILPHWFKNLPGVIQSIIFGLVLVHFVILAVLAIYYATGSKKPDFAKTKSK